MKIGLLTIHNANNYGAILQAYASKYILSYYGEVKTINYNNKYIARHGKILRFEFSIHGFKMLIHDLIRLPFRISVINKINNFINNHLNLTNQYSSKDFMGNETENFDLYVCGSDQIWNPSITNRYRVLDEIYLLGFVKKGIKKISYASSMGHHNFDKNEKKLIKKYLSDFKSISLREKSGKDIISEILPNKTIYHVLDPTLLLTQNQWIELFDIKPKVKKDNYILVYSVLRKKLIKDAVNYYRKKLKMKVYSIDQMLFSSIKIDKHIRDAGPKEFIEYFYHSTFVITDSYHGTCFALNFGIPFISVIKGEKSSRICDLLSLVDKKDRHISSKEQFSKLLLEYDTTRLFDLLNNFRDKSIEYLNKNIN